MVYKGVRVYIVVGSGDKKDKEKGLGLMLFWGKEMG